MLEVGGARAMLLLCLVLACVGCAHADPHPLRAHAHSHPNKELILLLTTIDERLRVLDTISVTQAKQARRLDLIQDKLDRIETTMSLKLERVQLATEKLEHRLNLLLQTSAQVSMSLKDRSSQMKIAEVAQNISDTINSHRILLEKVNGAYADTWHRGLVLEALVRDGQALVNVTRRELADGLRALARRQRDHRELEAVARRRVDRDHEIDLKIQEVLETQKRLVDSCQRVQQDDPSQVTDVLEKLMDSLINKTASTFHELQSIQSAVRSHDARVAKMFSGSRAQAETTCRRLESVFRNSSHPSFKENELQQLTEKFVALTDRADAALQRLESKLPVGTAPLPAAPESDVTAEADKLLLRLNSIKADDDTSDNDDFWGEEDEKGYFDDGGGGDIMDEDKQLLNQVVPPSATTEDPTYQPLHRRHLHKHPYDRGPPH